MYNIITSDKKQTLITCLTRVYNNIICCNLQNILKDINNQHIVHIIIYIIIFSLQKLTIIEPIVV